MSVVRLPDIGEQAASLVRRARDTGEAVEIEDQGVVVARVVPVRPASGSQNDLHTLWADLDEVAAEINTAWPRGLSAQDAVDDVRREL